MANEVYCEYCKNWIEWDRRTYSKHQALSNHASVCDGQWLIGLDPGLADLDRDFDHLSRFYP